ncbi:MAG: peptide-methionine (S)-S-oxide reductase, partial [Pseudonocardiaceae bacterium]
GTQYRSAVYTTDADQATEAEASRAVYQQALTAAGRGQISPEIAPLTQFYYAEDYHQQYLSDAKNPNGYCGIGGTGVSCPVGVSSSTTNPDPERL